MTMPALMNCAHSGDGWCLKCVAELEAENAALLARVPAEGDVVIPADVIGQAIGITFSLPTKTERSENVRMTWPYQAAIDALARAIGETK